MIHANIIVLIIDAFEPIEDRLFHEEKASGKSEYRRGIPLSPRKCCGKNVRLTLINMAIN